MFNYRTQLIYLRRVAEEALEHYAIGKTQLSFVNHGENTTYKVVTNRKKFLLRIHRENYHTKSAISEELKWLGDLANNPFINVQRPQLNKKGRYITTIKNQYLGLRYCDLLSWEPGHMRYKGLKPKDFFLLGELTAHLHQSAENRKVIHRKYWDIGGLLGPQAKMGNLESFRDLVPKHYETIIEMKDFLVHSLKSYEEKQMNSQSLIHADLHFGNLLWSNGSVTPIDFDDCGWGFCMYDLAVSLDSAYHLLKDHNSKLQQEYLYSLIDGYACVRNISEQDIQIIPFLIEVRSLVMAGWVAARSDNPRIKSYLSHFEDKVFPRFKKVMKDGPSFI